jgi:hypothetical protein
VIDYALSGAEGDYLLSGFPEGTYTVSATKTGYRSISEALDHQSDTQVMHMHLSKTATAVVPEDRVKVPTAWNLRQNYPNPFNPVTTIEVTVAEQGRVSLRVFDVLGREVEQRWSGNLKPGVYRYRFDGSNLPSGIYYYRLRSDTFSEVKKMILIR